MYYAATSKVCVICSSKSDYHKNNLTVYTEWTEKSYI